MRLPYRFRPWGTSADLKWDSAGRAALNWMKIKSLSQACKKPQTPTGTFKRVSPNRLGMSGPVSGLDIDDTVPSSTRGCPGGSEYIHRYRSPYYDGGSVVIKSSRDSSVKLHVEMEDENTL
eukprot:Nk52_evm18s289 gene=Nk52_evmTU18s289